MLNIIILLAVLWQPTSHAYPAAAWAAPGVVRLTWTQEADGAACAWRRRAGADTALGCVAGRAGYDNARTIEGAFLPDDILWIEGQGQALPLGVPRFVFFPTVIQ